MIIFLDLWLFFLIYDYFSFFKIFFLESTLFILIILPKNIFTFGNHGWTVYYMSTLWD